MNARFVLDESSWVGATEATPSVLSDAVDQLLEQIDTARKRGEGVASHGDFWYADLGGGVSLYSVLFCKNCQLQLDHDQKLSLMHAVDKTTKFDDLELSDYDAAFGGTEQFAPGVAWAHARCLSGHHVAVLPLDLRRALAGSVPVAINRITTKVTFVVKESDHLGFFRSVINLEKADEKAFECLANSAFPELKWSDDVWRGLGNFSEPYVDIREKLARCLGGLNDHGAVCFREHGAGDPRELSRRLSAKIGKETSDENGETKKHRPSEKDRTTPVGRVDKTFWWHVKLQPHIDRIYFLYDKEGDFIVVGIFKDHCVMPG